MRSYIDASLIVAALALERHTNFATRWLKDSRPYIHVTSLWVTTEVASALALKVRMGEIDEALRGRLLNLWRNMTTESFEAIAIEARHFELATVFVAHPGVNLRAGDALHLAVSSVAGLPIATLDRRMADAATLIGIPVAVSPPG